MTKDESTAAAKKMVYRVHVDGSQSHACFLAVDWSQGWEFSLSGGKEAQAKVLEVADKLRPLSRDLKESADSKAPDEVLSELVERSQELGLELRPNTYEFKFEIDSRSGMQVGRASFEGNAERGDLAQRIAQSLAGVPERLRSEAHEAIRHAIDSGDLPRAASLLSEWHGNSQLLGSRRSDLELARQIPTTGLKGESLKHVLRARIAFAGILCDYGTETRSDLDLLYDALAEDLDGEARKSLLVLEGLLDQAEGKVGTASAKWRQATSATDDSIRGQAHMQLSWMHPKTAEEAAVHAERAADSFLQAGELSPAARCLRRLSACLGVHDSDKALRTLERASDLFEASSPSNEMRRAGILRTKAELLLSLQKKREALEALLAAIELLRGLLGAEERLAMALSLASHIASLLGERALESSLFAEAQAVAEQSGDAALKNRLAARQLGGAQFDDEVAIEIKRTAEENGDVAGAALITTLRALNGTLANPVEELERTIAKLKAAGASKSDAELVKIALGNALLRANETQLGLRQFREVLERNPTSQEARNGIAGVLLAKQMSREAVAFFEEQRRMFGDMPGILLGLCRAQNQLGECNLAATNALGCMRLVEQGHPYHSVAQKELGLATSKGGVPQPSRDAVPIKDLTHDEFFEVLQEFATHLSADIRKSFWQPVDKDKKVQRKWVSKPESLGQLQLRTFLTGKLGNRYEILDEVDAGGGRIDIYVVGHGGFRGVIELKMVGPGYSSRYAENGVSQVSHYLENKQVNVGYLVAIDGRSREFGRGIPERIFEGGKTIRTIFSDVRPDSPSKPRIS